MHRKINLPPEYDSRTGYSHGGIATCNHDYPPRSIITDGIITYTCTQCGMLRMYKRMDHRDVFKSGLRLPKAVCIMASGPTEPGDEEKIPHGVYLLAVNGGVRRCEADLWMCVDINLPKCEWWEAAYETYANRTGKPITLFGELLDAKYPADYTFRDGRALNYDNFIPMENELRIAATISCQALQLCLHLGVQMVYIFGVNMKGNAYFDGSTSDIHAHEQVWNCVNRFNSVIRYMREKGMRIEFLTETALDKKEANARDTS